MSDDVPIMDVPERAVTAAERAYLRAIVASAREAQRQLKEAVALLQEAMAWLKDPSAYAQHDGRRFNARVSAFLARTDGAEMPQAKGPAREVGTVDLSRATIAVSPGLEQKARAFWNDANIIVDPGLPDGSWEIRTVPR
jgi:hypothetical protein